MDWRSKKYLTDKLAQELERKGMWRRAARRWLEVFDNAHDEKVREAAARRRDYCQRRVTDFFNGD
ncbi:ANR family transcriptional regulator [Yersinia kristensenii]|uniref:ANR family transcriptional regulator n=1 Tax=Yersinia kristensenii TaxID=28152 RepID=UPI001C611171|nr:ANR family transcriptional regulator [Yersinia kristensenii]MBW5824449.1 ANR family transcriptional regulator [Yersinia kristensenii]HEI6797194.1 ANR family transcriptional regulator [Yersinia enterocolitica]